MVFSTRTHHRNPAIAAHVHLIRIRSKWIYCKIPQFALMRLNEAENVAIGNMFATRKYLPSE